MMEAIEFLANVSAYSIILDMAFSIIIAIIFVIWFIYDIFF